MKTTQGNQSAPQTGRVYWQSLDQLADTPEFKQWVQREFPEGASEWTDPLSRRHFVKIMSASFLLAGIGLGATGCRRPQERILPFTRLPEGYVHGVAEYFATSMPGRTGAQPLLVKSHEGRPIKIEGNDLWADSGGATDRWAQASILNLYDPDRASQFKEKGSVRAPEAAFEFLAALGKQCEADGGRGLAILMEPSTSPSRRRLQEVISKKYPQARWFLHDPVDADIHRRSASLAFNRPVRPVYHLDKADVIVALDCDFLGSEEDTAANIRKFASRRRLKGPQDSPNRLYVVESLMSLTGISADHRLRTPASSVVQVAAGIASGLPGGPAELQHVGQAAGVDPNWIAECAKDLQAHKGKCVVLAGHRQPMVVHLLAHAMNVVLGNVGQTVDYVESSDAKEGTLVELTASLDSGDVNNLVILGSNPVYTSPGDLDFAQAQRKAKTVVRLGYSEDETFALCDWHLPAAHYLESWGDARATDGTVTAIQPLIAPLMGGLTELEVLARLAGEKTTAPYDIVRTTFATLTSGGESDSVWNKFLHSGILQGSAAAGVQVQLNVQAITQALAATKVTSPGRDSLEVVFHRDYSLDDGRYNNNGWLQELPDPITKLVWDNVVLVSRKTAQTLSVKNGDLVDITAGGRTIQGPIWIQPGQADFCLGLALGYGRQRSGRVGNKTGFNVYPLRSSTSGSVASGATVRPTGKTYPLSSTQEHWSLEGRPIIREANLDQYRKDPTFAKKMGKEELPIVTSMYPNPLDNAKKGAVHQWGMSIDLNMCVGCSACVMACQSENNIPIVGKQQVAKGREMHWLRIDRYYAGKKAAAGSKQAKENYLSTYRREREQQFEEWIDNPQVVTQPMLCQHCEAAPCENVCPVNATTHDHEGLNVMAYNRCVGTRYCSNNCPYKVRRFNFFDYNKRPIDKLYFGPLAKRNEDEWDLIRMIKNPDVTVRMRGVMEKCTFCVQRIEAAKISQKVKAGASSDIVVPEGTFTTACAQACPAGAIVFGNLDDPQSRVSQLKSLDRDYPVLEMLLTKPRTTYLARVRNPNPAMPDYDMPMTLREYEEQTGGAKSHSAAGHDSAAAVHGAEKGAH